MMKMPRGAIPTPRSELAASEPYRPDPGLAIFVPSEFPAPNHELATAQPYRSAEAAPESFLAWPAGLEFWGNDQGGSSLWAEEAFAKACAQPSVRIPAALVLSTASECGGSNFAEFMQSHGFHLDGKAYLDGPFYSIDWTNTTVLNGAIANVGPVKIGAASASLRSAVTPGTSGWAIHGLPAGHPEDHCASLCGFGSAHALADLFGRHGVNGALPPDMPAGLCYAVFTWGSIGIVDRQSMLNITNEAWVRNPTTIVKALS